LKSDLELEEINYVVEGFEEYVACCLTCSLALQTYQHLTYTRSIDRKLRQFEIDIVQNFKFKHMNVYLEAIHCYLRADNIIVSYLCQLWIQILQSYLKAAYHHYFQITK